jgi:hypothetical protein
MRDTKKDTPDFTNNDGVHWWYEPMLTRYALSKGLTDMKVWTVHRPDGHKTRLLTEGQNILAEDQMLEGLGLKIDLLSFQRQTAG